MWELRWVLLGLGALLVLGVYLWGKGVLPFAGSRRKRRPGSPLDIRPVGADSRRRAEPRLSADDSAEPQAVDFEAFEEFRVEPVSEATESPPSEALESAEPSPPPMPKKIVALRFVPREQELNCARVVQALRAAGLRHGRYGIFHRLTEETGAEPLFSVASLTEPGSFDLTKLHESTLPGMSFFLIAPGVGDPVERFDDMVETARSLAHDLDAELYDDGGSSWSIQRERYLREELIQYRHELSGHVEDVDRQIDGFR